MVVIAECDHLYRAIIFQCSPSHDKVFGIEVRGRGSFLCEGEEGVAVPQVNQSRNSVCYSIWLSFK